MCHILPFPFPSFSLSIFILTVSLFSLPPSLSLSHNHPFLFLWKSSCCRCQVMKLASGFYTSFSQHILYTLVSDGAKKNIMEASRTVWDGILYSIPMPTFHFELRKFVEPSLVGVRREGSIVKASSRKASSVGMTVAQSMPAAVQMRPTGL